MGNGTVCEPNSCPTSGVTGGELSSVPGLRIAPNPTSGRTIVQAYGPLTMSARITVYSASGRVVRSLWEGPMTGRAFEFTWDGLDDSGREVPAGMYLFRLTTPSGEATGRVVVAR